MSTLRTRFAALVTLAATAAASLALAATPASATSDPTTPDPATQDPTNSAPVERVPSLAEVTLPAGVDPDAGYSAHLPSGTAAGELPDDDFNVGGQLPLYRFYKNDGTHFYTASTNEAVSVALLSYAEYHYEGIVGLISPASRALQANEAYLYRFYKNDGTHFYTASAEEAAQVRGYAQYKDEGRVGIVQASATGANLAVSRFYKVAAGTHFYTASAYESSLVMQYPQYSYEGDGFFISPLPAGVSDPILSLPSPQELAARAIVWARAQLGKPYQWGSWGDDGMFDCSGLVGASWLYGGLKFIGYNSRVQYQWVPKVPAGQMQPGDLLFWATNTADPSTIYHVAMYTGNGKMIEAMPKTGVVEVSVRKGYLPLVGRP